MFTSGANIVVVGINITTQVKFTGLCPHLSLAYVSDKLHLRNLLCEIISNSKISDADLLQLRHSEGRYGQFISDICQFYRDWHVKSDGVHGSHL